jgi:acylglycerol lipase
MGSYRLSLRRAVPWKHADTATRHRWALTALDPRRASLFVGSHNASDGAQVPYRFWRADTPRALLLMLHGCCDYAGAFDDIAPKLAKQGIACLAYDQRGFGATVSHGMWTSQERITQDALDMARFLRARAQRDLPLFILGESMGGSVAVHTAASHADLDIAGLVLVAPGALACAIRNRFYRWLMRGLSSFAGQSEIIVERTNATELTAAAAIRLLGDPLVMQSIRPDLLDGVIAMGFAAVEAASKVSVPTLTVVAGKDDLLRGECVRELHDNLQGPKTWAPIESGPHLLLHWRRGDVVLSYIHRWIGHRLERHFSDSRPGVSR